MKKSVLNAITDYFLIGVGSFILSLGMNVFLVPAKLSSGGLGTVGTIFLHMFGIPLSFTNLLFNVVLFFFGYRFLGKSAVAKTVAGILTLTLFLQLTSYFPAFSGDVIISAIAGGLLVGIGVGLAVRRRASTGGSDFAALMIKHFAPHISLAAVIFIIDFVIIITAGFVFKSFTVTFYSAVAMFVSAKITDIIVSFGDFAKTVYIVSERHVEIKKKILEKFHRGVTAVYSKGGYTDNDGMMLFCVVSPKQVPYVVGMVRGIDRRAFIVISDSREVLGEGFKTETEYDKIEVKY